MTSHATTADHIITAHTQRLLTNHFTNGPTQEHKTYLWLTQEMSLISQMVVAGQSGWTIVRDIQKHINSTPKSHDPLIIMYIFLGMKTIQVVMTDRFSQLRKLILYSITRNPNQLRELGNTCCRSIDAGYSFWTW